MMLKLFAVKKLCILSDRQDELSQLKLVWVDAGYSGSNLARAVVGVCGAKVEVIQRSDSDSRFQVLPRPWVAEPTFSYLVSSRRFSLDYELLLEVKKAMIYASLVRFMLLRLAY